MKPKRYVISIVASLCDPEDSEDGFEFQDRVYKWADDLVYRNLFSVIKSIKEFTLEIATPPNNDSIELIYYPDRIQHETATNSQKRIRWSILQEFFAQKPDQEDSSSSYGEGEYELLYECLRRKHIANPKTVPVDVQHEKLLPSLRAYQKEGISFLIYRETVLDSVEAAFSVFINALNEGTNFYFDWFTGLLTDVKPENYSLPTGGILADEMGLGKTVEMISLILCNPRTDFNNIKSDTLTRPIPGLNFRDSCKFKCVCRSLIKENLICCTKCEYYQHIDCVQKNRIETSLETTDNYICPQCWPQEARLQTGATIIVSPYSISRQWLSEIKRHIREPFRVLVYSGVSKLGWISPLDMAQYDVVITDYNVLKSEIYYAEATTERALRRDKKYLNHSSPLNSLNWWRVCLDEAQMVEGLNTNATQMAKQLSTVHRWAVTGTPIEKSVNQLFGLLHFLDCEPYNYQAIWARLANPFIVNNNPEPLVAVLKHIMWRCCKRHVIDQIGIPPQSQRTHMVTMSDLQSVFYKDQHEQCRVAFLAKAFQMQKQGLPKSMAQWNPHSLKALLEPMRKLRQDCTVPCVISKGDQMSKRLLSPDDLYAHMLSQAEIDSKSRLRAIASNLNGLAGIACIDNDYQLAIKYYKAVLKRATENSGSVTVDSLLQIHALHNLIGLLRQRGQEDIDCNLDECEKQLRALETKYTGNYYQLMKTAGNNLKVAKQKVHFKDHIKVVNLWGYILTEHCNAAQETSLINKINIDIHSNGFTNFSNGDFHTGHGVLMALITWWDNVQKCRQKVYKGLKSLKFFTEKISPGYVPTEKERRSIEALVLDAAECHLIFEKKAKDAQDEGDETGPQEKKARKTLCILCQTKLALSEYECKIFDKTFDEDKMENEGTWKPSWQEWVAGILNQVLRREVNWRENQQCEELEDEYEEYKNHLKEAGAFDDLMDSLKTEYRELSKYWIEINYTTASYDELTMCKLQLSAVDPETLKKGEKLKRNQISIHEVCVVKQELQSELNAEEMAFVKSTHNLSYLKHLASNLAVQTCPICDHKPEDKYSVWQCGHQMCIPCLLAMKKYHGLKLSCPVCRHSQTFNDMHYVTVTSKSSVPVQGKYSSKVVRIVQEVQTLKNEDDKVKIIIFSQWETNLKMIGSALLENNVTYRTKTSLAKIEEFKNPDLDITCLLLPLSWGSKGLNLIEATHVFLVEPILNPSDELQAIGRVHRIGQTRPTMIHRFIVDNTIEETIYRNVSSQSGKWKCKDISVDNLIELFNLKI